MTENHNYVEKQKISLAIYNYLSIKLTRSERCFLYYFYKERHLFPYLFDLRTHFLFMFTPSLLYIYIIFFYKMCFSSGRG